MVKKLKKTIMNFNEKSNFFFHIENFLKFFRKTKNKNYLKPSDKEIDVLNNLIKIYENIISGNEISERKIIKIKNDFYEGLKNFEPVNKIKTDYGTKVENIIKFLNKENIKINLKNIQIKFEELYNKKYSLMTFSRILKNHLNLHFLKNKIKNPKLNKNLHIFMTHFFIKGIVRALSLN